MTSSSVIRAGRIGNIEVKIVENAEQMGRFVGELLAAQIAANPETVLGLCTGGTPVPIYQHLVQMYSEHKVSFARLTSFNLDEYYPMEPADPHSFQYFMNQHLFDLVDIDRRKAHIPSGIAPNPQEAAAEYENAIRRAGGIDLLLTGLGHNTHIGFNEPPSDASSRTRLVALSEQTRAMNARFFEPGEDVPKQSITMGIGTILDARSIILCAKGAAKAEAVYATLCGPVSASKPGSFLQRHTNTLAVFDREAASLLPLAD